MYAFFVKIFFVMAAAVQLNINLSEFIYTIAREAPLSAKRRLPEKFFNAILTETKAKRFSVSSSFEQKREFLAYLGIEQFVILADVNKMAHKDIREVLQNIDINDKPSNIIKKLAEDNIYISSNREYCYSLLNISRLFNTKVYAANLDLIRSSFHEKNWSKNIDVDTHKETKEEIEAMGAFVKFVGAVLAASSSSEITSEVDSETLKMLLFLYRVKEYESQQTISIQCGLSMRQSFLSIARCVELMFVQKHPKQSKKEYQITATGILAVNRFVEKVIKMLDF